MPAPDLVDLLREYSLAGLDDWRRASNELRSRARDCLGAPIAEHPTEVDITINTIVSPNTQDQLRFIPMPKHPRRSAERSFFVPVRHIHANGDETARYELFLLVNSRNCLAFRFEPSHPNSTHGYSHVQLSRQLLKRTIDPSGIPPWIPDSYPAIPIPSANPLHMFLSVAVSVHGYTEGLKTILQNVFQQRSRPRDGAIYIHELSKILR